MLKSAPQNFELPLFEKPVVSIVIPVYNQYLYTHICLWSIAKFTPPSIPYEVVILDDCSTDQTKTIEEHIKNVRVFRNETNQGFLKNCNAYISKVRGKYVFLMNNDMEVTEGWLEPAIKALKERGVGLVTSCVLNTDGTVQTTGLTLGKDGDHLANYYELSPLYLKDKNMDVHSAYGCAMCFEKSLWNKLGGFDELYLPAYFEEIDFSMKIRYQLKKRIVCVANSQIFHYGMMSYTGKGQQLTEINKQKFINRWQKELKEDGIDVKDFAQFLDDMWRWDTIRFLGMPVLKSYYKDDKKTYYLGKHKLFSRPFNYEEKTPNQCTMLESTPETFELPVFEKPIVSIVIPVYNQYSYTHACIYSILKFTENSIPYEVMVLDDCSTDETQTIETRIKNVRVFRNKTNQGFLKNCNTYIPQARGKYVFLMNNDMEVMSGWLSPVIKALKKHGIGIVNSCVLNPDGTIQAAGWTLMKDGVSYPNALNLSPKFLKNRIFDISYAFGCAMSFEKSLWEKLGGFDELYLPAYCEDSDFSLRCRYQLKKRIVCVGNSQIFHYGNVSHKGKVDDLITVNNAKLFKRWQNEFEKDGIAVKAVQQYSDEVWRWNTKRFLGLPILKSYYKGNCKTYYLGHWKLFSKRFVYDD